MAQFSSTSGYVESLSKGEGEGEVDLSPSTIGAHMLSHSTTRKHPRAHHKQNTCTTHFCFDRTIKDNSCFYCTCWSTPEVFMLDAVRHTAENHLKEYAGRVAWSKCDLRNLDAIRSTIEKAAEFLDGRIDFLINSAGTSHPYWPEGKSRRGRPWPTLPFWTNGRPT